jgi:hypothetical protein
LAIIVLTINQVLWLKFSSFTGSPIHPPLGALNSPPAGSGIDDVFPTWRKNNIRVCPVASPADGGGDGATKAKQEAAPRRLSSESMAPAPQRGTRRA